MKKVLDVAEFYDREAILYDAVRWDSVAGAYTDMVQQAIVSQLLGNLHGLRLLEIGAGTGRFTPHLIEEGAEVTALDISLPMLSGAGEVLPSDRSLIQADAISLPFLSNSFDGCLSVNVFSHMVNYEAGLQEIGRVLQPGGFLVVNFPNLWSYYWLAALWVNIRRRSIRREVYTHWHTLRSFRAACAQGGLVMKRIIGQVHLPDGRRMAGLQAMLKGLDRLSRRSFLRYLCPTLFIRASKEGHSLPRSRR